MNPNPRTRHPDLSLAGAIFALMTASYLALAQGNPTYDGAAFVKFFAPVGHPTHPHHPLFSYVIHAFIRGGATVGWDAWTSGLVQSASLMALAVALDFLLMRRRGVGRVASGLFALLFGVSATAIENGTSVELYGLATLVSVLAFWALGEAADRPGVARKLALFAAAFLCLGSHIGFAFWIFAIYAALAWGERSTTRGLAWLGQGLAVALGVGAWLVLEGRFSGGDRKMSGSFFDAFFTAPSGWAMLGQVVAEPLYDAARWAGPLLFPAVLGARAFSRERPAEARALGVAAILFIAFYSYWPGDQGSFYLPLMPPAGMFAAMAVERVSRSGDARVWVRLLLAMTAYALLFCVLPRDEFAGYIPAPNPIALSAAFWIVGALQWSLGGRIRGGAAAPEDASAPPATVRFRLLAYGACALALAVGASLPRALNLREPDAETRMHAAFRAVAPEGARLATSRPPFRPEVQTGHATLSPLLEWDKPAAMVRAREALTGWLRESLEPGGPPVYLDAVCHEKRAFIWGVGLPWGRVLPPPDKIAFRPIPSRGELFFRVEFLPGAREALEAAELAPYPPELWDNVPVRWTREAARVTTPVSTPRLAVRYWVGHPDVSAARPVKVEIWIEGGPRVASTHTAQGAFEAVLDASAWSGKTAPVRIAVTPTWIAPEGRRLGVAVYPIEGRP